MFRSTAARVSVFFFLVAGLLGATPVGSTPVAAADNWINTSDRDAVIQAYETEFANPDPASGWTGSRQSCTPGTTSQTFRDAIFSRVNYFRGMAGVPAGITENPTWSAHAQEAALMMSASSALSHSPTPWDGTTAGYNANIHGYKCYTAAGATAAGSSDLYLGRTGPRAITGYIEDPGANNTRVGHRNWIFHPTTTQMGTGDIPSSGGWSSNTLWVFDNVFGAQPALRENQGFVAWPPRGYVPGELVFPRWSISVRNGDFSNASITMRQDGSSVSNAVVHRDGATSGAPFPIIVWEPVGVNLNPSIDTTYEVTVSGAKVNGVSTTFSYNVVILGDTPAAGGQSPSQYNEFVSRSYQDFVGRAPNDSELTYWTQQLSNGLTRFAFVEALANSDAWIANVVNELYVNTLGRSADQPGREFWTANLQQGWSVAQVAASFYGSSEYVASKGGTYDAWVVDLYGVLLERNADGGGRAYWAEQASSVGSGTVAFRFYQSDESREARVIALYQKFLGRNPDTAGLAYWAEVLESGDDLRLAAFLASSDEYFAG